MKKGIKIFMILCLTLLLAASSFAAGKHGRDLFWLTLLQNNDGESQLINAGSGLEGFGGAARFTTVIRKARFQARFGFGHLHMHSNSKSRMGVITLSSGDNFPAGPEFSASLEKGIPFPDLEADNGLVLEKVEGLMVTANGDAFIVTDNDGVVDSSGETQLINLGSIFTGQ